MKLTRNRIFKTPVSVSVPAETGMEVSTFTGHFRALTTEELALHRLGTIEEQDAYLGTILVGWDGITDDRDGVDVPLEFTAANVALVIGDMFVRKALLDTYAAALAGVKRGN